MPLDAQIRLIKVVAAEDKFHQPIWTVTFEYHSIAREARLEFSVDVSRKECDAESVVRHAQSYFHSEMKLLSKATADWEIDFEEMDRLANAFDDS